MRNYSFHVALIIAATMGVVIAVDLPQFIHVCKRNDPNIIACMTDSVESLKPYLQKGVPEYNIPTLEPLLLKELVATEGSGIKITARDIKAYGASDFTVTKLNADLDKLHFNLDVSLPHLYIEGSYEIDGKVLLLPIRGAGPMTGNFTKCVGSVKIRASRMKNENGQDYMHITDFKMKITVGKGSLNLENLFGGERVLGEVINSAINSNFNAFLRELQPIVEKALSDAFREIANSIINQFLYEQLFPEA